MFRLVTRRVLCIRAVFKAQRILPLVVPTCRQVVRMSSNSTKPDLEALKIEAVDAAIEETPKSPRPTRSEQPIVWIDCEMSGLKPGEDKLLQVACFITDAQLDLLDPIGFETVISRPQSLMDSMDEWCTTTHATTGLTARVLSSNVSITDASEQLLAYIKSLVPTPRSAILAGNSVHFDRVFMALEMPEVVNYLHYRIGDLSSIKEFAKRWWGLDMLEGMPKKLYTHEAKQDILESIEEARYYRRELFKASNGGPSDRTNSDLLI